jgi:hypothetical protein
MDVGKQIMVDRKRAAEMFGISPGTLSNMLSQRKGPIAYKFGKKVLYRVDDLVKFFTSCPISTDAMNKECLNEQ